MSNEPVKFKITIEIGDDKPSVLAGVIPAESADWVDIATAVIEGIDGMYALDYGYVDAD